MEDIVHKLYDSVKDMEEFTDLEHYVIAEHAAHAYDQNQHGMKENETAFAFYRTLGCTMVMCIKSTIGDVENKPLFHITELKPYEFSNYSHWMKFYMDINQEIVLDAAELVWQIAEEHATTSTIPE